MQKEKFILDEENASINEAFPASNEDYIEDELNRNKINFDYIEQDGYFGYKFDSYDDMKKAEEIICSIVGSEYETNKKDFIYLTTDLIESKLNEGHDIQEYKGYTLDWNMDNVDPEEGIADFTVYIQKDGKDVTTAQGFKQAKKWCDEHRDAIVTKEFEVAGGIDFDPEEYNIEIIEVGTKSNTVTYKLIGKKEDIIQCIENEFNSDDYSMKDFFNKSLEKSSNKFKDIISEKLELSEDADKVNGDKEDLPVAELKEPIVVSTEVEEESVPEEVVQNAHTGMIGDLIKQHFDLLDNYRSVIATLVAEDKEYTEQVVEILNSAMDEESIILGMLTKASELIDDKPQELMQQGEDKAEEIAAESEHPVDESLQENWYTEVKNDFEDFENDKVVFLNSMFCIVDEQGQFGLYKNKDETKKAKDYKRIGTYSSLDKARDIINTLVDKSLKEKQEFYYCVYINNHPCQIYDTKEEAEEAVDDLKAETNKKCKIVKINASEKDYIENDITSYEELDESLQLNEGHDIQEYKGFELDWNADNLDVEEGTADFRVDILLNGKEIGNAIGYRRAREWCDNYIKEMDKKIYATFCPYNKLVLDYELEFMDSFDDIRKNATKYNVAICLASNYDDIIIFGPQNNLLNYINNSKDIENANIDKSELLNKVHLFKKEELCKEDRELFNISWEDGKMIYDKWYS